MQFQVPNPMTERPCYAMGENPTIRQLRQTVVKAMRDMVTIQWSTNKEIRYNKLGAVSGKTDFHATFNWLWEKAYIPVTSAELAGLVPYERAWVNFAGAGVSVEQLMSGVFQSNYPMCLLKVLATDAEGKKTEPSTVRMWVPARQEATVCRRMPKQWMLPLRHCPAVLIRSVQRSR